MHHYDVAAKVLIESCGAEIIRHFIGIETEELSIIEPLPQETVSLKRSDYPVLVTDIHGMTRLIILEIQTNWNRYVPLNLLDYRTRYLLRHDHEIISCVILLRPSNSAADCYQDNEISFRYRLIRIYEMDARQIISDRMVCLMPFVPLMRNGQESLTAADNMIYQSNRTKTQKADMLTSMAILSGLVSEDMPAKLIARRKDIMIESAAYEIIKKEAFQEGIREGIQQGIREGLLKAIDMGLRLRFGTTGLRLMTEISKIRDTDVLNMIYEGLKTASSLDEIQQLYEK